MAVWLNQWFPFLFVVRLPMLAAEIGIIILLNRMAGIRAAALYAASPIAILISSPHGQFDSLPILCVLLALCYHRYAAWLLAIGTSLKMWPVLLLPAFLKQLNNWSGRLRFIAIVLLPTTALVAPFVLTNFSAVMHEFVGYSGYADYGLGLIAQMLANLGSWNLDIILTFGKFAFLILYVFVCLHLREKSPALSCAMILAAFYAVYPGISAQYLLWLLPVALLVDWRFGLIYNLAGTAALIGGYDLLALIPLTNVPLVITLVWISSSIVWWYVSARWLFLKLRQPSYSTITARFLATNQSK